MMEGENNCTKMKSDDTLKRKPSWKYRIVNFHKDILGANLPSLRLHIRTGKDNWAGDFGHNAELSSALHTKWH